MIKIIKEGTPPQLRTFRCNNCGCIFKADDESYTIDTIYPSQFSSLTVFKIHCPCCDDLVIIKEREDTT